MVKIKAIAILKMPIHNQDMIFLYADIPIKKKDVEKNNTEMVVIADYGKGTSWVIKNFPDTPYKYIGNP